MTMEAVGAMRAAVLPTRPKIAVRDLGKTFPMKSRLLEALRGLNLSVTPGEFCCIVGPSGCGKTTLLRILAGLERQTSGQVEIQAAAELHVAASNNFGADASRRPLTSMIFQEQSVFPWMTVEENVGYGLRMRRLPPRVRRETVRYYLDKVGLSGFARAYPFQLSGGMKQRVSVARAFANDPEVLLMDEPFASLDEQTKILLQEELLRIWEGSKKTVIFITHSIDEAVALGDRVLVMTARPGRIKAVVPVTLPRPRSVLELKGTPAFAELGGTVWALLRNEVVGGPAPPGRTREDGRS
jgi:NitT/TauT family transport system ATP-binding protein